MNIHAIISEINSLFEQQGGSEYFGENVTQYSHAAQAALLAEKQTADIEIQVAAFLHDIGHLLPSESIEQMPTLYGCEDHDTLAGDWLKARGFSKKIQAIVRNHVNAKKYLCCKDPTYFDTLSEASKETLKQQGGVMTLAESQVFEQIPYFKEIIQVRKIDDAAKEPHADLPPLGYFLDLCTRYLTPATITY